MFMKKNRPNTARGHSRSPVTNKGVGIRRRVGEVQAQRCRPRVVAQQAAYIEQNEYVFEHESVLGSDFGHLRVKSKNAYI